MKAVISIVITLLFSSHSFGQIWQKSTVNTKPNGVMADSVLIVPRDTAPKNNALYLGSPVGDSGRIAFKDGAFWGKDSVWRRLGSNSIDTASLSARIDQKLNISDTSSMLADYLRKVDTTGKWKPLLWFPGVSEVIGLQDSLSDRYTKDQSDARYLQGNQSITLSGDVLGSGTTSISTTLKNTGTAGTYTKVTTDAQGRVTSGTQLAAGDIPNLSATYIPVTQKGAANGVASLGSDGKVPSSQLPTTGSLYQGTWNASTNTPTIADGVGTAGWYYRVSTGGTQDLGSGDITFNAGDDVIYNGTIWQRVPAASAVSSVNGMTGDVVIDKDDVGLGNVDNTSDLAKPISTATQTALNGKEPTIAPGTTAQVWIGNKTWATTSTLVRPLFSAGTGLTYNSSTGAFAANFGTTAGTVMQGNDSRVTGAVPNTRTITAGTGLTGGGDLTANRSFAIDPAYASFTNYYTKTNLQTSGQAAVHWGNVTNAPTFWQSSNHPAGSAFTPTLTGANVLASMTVNSAGHVSALTTRTLLPSDIDAVSRTPSAVSWNDYITSGSAALMASSTGAPNANPWYGFSTGPDANNAAQFAMRGTDAYFRTRLGGVTGAWTPLATQSWVTSNFAAGSGSGNYIQNQIASAQIANAWVTGSLSSNGGVRVYSAPATAGFEMYNAAGSLRWIMRGETAESGSNSGQNFTLIRRDDSGGSLGTALSINRASGAVTIPGTVTISGKTIIPNLSGIAGSGSGTANIAWFGFYESNGTTRQGYVGKGSNGNDDIYLVSDIGNINFSTGTADKNINLNATGIVALNSATKNHLYFNANGVGAPTFNTRSVGTKVVLYPTLSASTADYGVGVETSHQWFSAPQNTTQYGFKWYGGTTEVARLSGTGQLSVNTSVTSPLLTAPSGNDLSISAPASHSLFFNPGGTNRGVWDGDGRLGIGVIPNSLRASLLEVNGNVWATDAYILGTTNNPTAEFGLQGGGTNGSAFLRTMGTGNLDIQTGASNTRIQINGTTGNVGVGTSATAYNLTVAGDVSFAGSNFTVNSLGQTVVGGTLTADGEITANGGLEIGTFGQLTIPQGAGTGKVLTSDGSGNASWQVPGQKMNVTARQSGNYTVGASDQVVLLNPSTSGFTLTLPTAASSTGRVLWVRNLNTGTTPVNSSISIIGEGGTITAFPAQLTLQIISDGTDWIQIGK